MTVRTATDRAIDAFCARVRQLRELGLDQDEIMRLMATPTQEQRKEQPDGTG